MTTLLEDLRAELRQVCQAVGLSGTAASVVPLVLLGVALNAAALTVIGGVRPVYASACNRPALGSAARTELKVVRAVVVSTLKTVSDGRKRWCSAQQQEPDQRFGIADLHVQSRLAQFAALFQ